ncbi:MAG: guanylate kinase [Candidatus Omnitrophota bacterium]|nr:guanylate kinase [Candidatus Omnitrophota bacterium]
MRSKKPETSPKSRNTTQRNIGIPKIIVQSNCIRENQKPESKKIGLIFIVSGPSGSGKTTLIKHLLGKDEYRNNLKKAVTCTTRKPRGKEKNGQDYIFINEREFKNRIKRKEFFEWQRVLGSFYGTPQDEVEKNLLSGSDVILCIDVKGAEFLRGNRKCRFVYIFILPSGKDWRQTLKIRLTKRSSEPQREIEKRLKLAEKEIFRARDYDHVVINKNIEEATDELGSIIACERLKG